MPRADALLFDLDGTIVDSRVPYSRCLNHALTGVGLAAVAPEELYQYLGPPIHETLIEHLGVPVELVDRCIELYRERYIEKGLAETEVFAGVSELLRALHGRVPLAVATSKASTLARPVLERLGLAGVFEVIAGADPAAVNEPKSATIAVALEGLGGRGRLGNPPRAVMIGDRFHDVDGARVHGMQTVGVLWGVGGEDELRGAGAAALVERPDQIPEVLGL